MKFDWGADAIELSVAPRHVPWITRCRLLFGEPIFFLVWVFAALMLHVWVEPLESSEVITRIEFMGRVIDTSGRVTAVEPLHGAEDDDEDETGYRVRFEYTWEGRTYRGTGYAFGGAPKRHALVPLRLPSSRPDRAMVAGLQARPNTTSVLWVGVLPALALLIGAAGVADGRRKIKLLRYGDWAPAVLISREEDRDSDGDLRETLTYGYTVMGTQYEHEVVVGAGDRRDYRAKEPLLYDPSAPHSATAHDHLPGGVRFDADGQVTAPTALHGAAALVGTALVSATAY